jgi:predicted ATPase
MPGRTLSNQHLRVYLTGGFRLEIRGEPIRLPTRKTRSLLAYLILHPGAHNREKLATQFWGDSPDSVARGSLSKALTFLRKQIDGDLIIADRETVQLNPSYPMCVDLYDFEQQAERLLGGSAAQAGQFKDLAYEGELLDEFYDEWILPLRAHYQNLHIDVLLCGVEQARGQSEYPLAIEYAQKVLKCDPANERAHQHLMFCYITLGERTKALEQYEACQRALLDELAVEPTQETQALHRWIKQYEAESTSLAARITNLPIPISSFVGRGRETSKIKGMITNNRLVTLTGPGGSGKTRLAIHAATDLIDSFKDGVWWVELAPVNEPSLVPFALARVLGLEGRTGQPVIETLKKFLCDKKALIVLDNCEHLIEACPHLTETLLTCCADLKVLATSREALCLPGENVWLVPPLTLPETETNNLLDLLMEYESVRLFVERAKAASPAFKPDDETAILIAQVCQRLDGIPLAIELAASRVRSMLVKQISAGLDNAFQLLARGNRTTNMRHQTLQATVDWSYDLLSEPERQLFCRLSIFSGGWSQEAAEAVCSGDGVEREEVPDLLARLVDKSLVKFSVDAQRYSMLETMRQYGDEKLVQRQEKCQIFERYLDHYVKMAGIGDEKIRGPEQRTWLKWFEMEQENLKNALEGAFGSSDMLEEGCELLCHMSWYVGLVRGNTLYLKRWMDIALPRSAELGRVPIRARLLFKAGALTSWGNHFLDIKDAKAAIEDSLGILREQPQDHLLEQGQCLLALGWIQKLYFLLYNQDTGIQNFHRSIEIFKKLDNPWWHAWALNFFARVQDFDEHYFQVREDILNEGEALFEQAGDVLNSAIPLFDMGTMALAQGRLHDAQKYLLESLEIFRSFAAKRWIFRVLLPLGVTTRGLKEYDRAEAYYKESLQYVKNLIDEGGLAYIYLGLGYIALARSEMEQSREYFNKALKITRELDFDGEILISIAGLACLAVLQNKLVHAARLLAAFYKHLEAFENKFKRGYLLFNQTWVDRQEIQGYLDDCKTRLGEKAFEAAWAEGSALSVDEMLDEVVRVSD